MKTSLKLLSIIAIILSLWNCGKTNTELLPGEVWIINNFEVFKIPSKQLADSDRILQKRLNTKAEILDSKDNTQGWYKVNILSDSSVITTGWVESRHFIRASKTTNWGLIKSPYGGVNIREERDTTSPIVSKLEKGQKIKAFYYENNWFAVFNIEDTTIGESKALGYVYAPLFSPPKKTAKPLLPYTIVKKEDHSYYNTPRMTYRVMLSVDKLPSEHQMKQVASKLWKNGNTKWKEFTIFFYLTGMATDDIAYGIANFTPRGLDSFNINDFALQFYPKWKK